MLSIRVTNKWQDESFEVDGAVLIGRRPSEEMLAECRNWTNGANPVVIKISDKELGVSKDQFLLRSMGDEINPCVSVKNVSDKVRADASSSAVRSTAAVAVAIDVGQDVELSLPARVAVGTTIIEIELLEYDTEEVARLSNVTCALPRDSEFSTGSLFPKSTVETSQLIQWLQRIVTVQRAAIGSDEYYQQTARAVVDLIGLAWGMVLLRESDSWEVAACYKRSNDADAQYSHAVLKQLAAKKATVFQIDHDTQATESLKDLSAFVASPIFDFTGERIIGAIYGAQQLSTPGETARVSQLEAQLVQVLAAAVEAGLARRDSELEASRRHIQLEQFVSPQIVRELDRDPTLMEGRDVEVTALFADIRNFSSTSERLPASTLCELVRDIMTLLAEQVRNTDGTTVSYLGDGLLAMWNAPVPRENHAARACEAAMSMINVLPHLNRKWTKEIGGGVELGVGINSGLATVGNTGGRFKPQYGPLGHTVNLASRVEGATKKLGVPILITSATRAGFENEFATRRLCRVRVVGIGEAVDLFELHPGPPSADWTARRDAYESALKHFEAGNWSETCSTLFTLLRTPDGAYDQPSLTLVSRAVDLLKSPPQDFDPVWDFLTK